MKPYRGWLTNPERKERQQKSLAFNENDVQELITQIENMPNYISKSLGPEIDNLLRLRDKALISVGWTFFKRGSEILGVKRGEVSLDEKYIRIKFHIKKKSKRFKICPTCLLKGKEVRSGYKSNFCRECKTDLQDVEIQGTNKEFTATKRMTLRYKFIRYIVDWLKTFDELTENLGIKDNSEAWFFPSLQVSFNTGWLLFFKDKQMSVQNLDHILQKLDPTITSSFFRYFRTEELLDRGYLPHELKQVGDWANSFMPELYAARKGLTPILQKFGEDR